MAFKVIDPPAADNDQPEAIAKVAIEAMHELQTVRSEGLGIGENRAKYEEAMGRLFGVADQDEIYEAMKPGANGSGGSPFAPIDITKNAAIRKVAESWTSKTAYYIDGLKMDTLTAKPIGQDRMMVTVVAVNAEEREMLAKIRSQSGMGPADSPFKDLTKDQQEKIRTETLKHGFNVPIEAEIRLQLARTDKGWRVQKVDVGPARR